MDNLIFMIKIFQKKNAFINAYLNFVIHFFICDKFRKKNRLFWIAHTKRAHTQYVFQFHVFFFYIQIHHFIWIYVYYKFYLCHKSKISQSVRRCGSRRSHYRLLAAHWIKRNGPRKREKKESVFESVRNRIWIETDLIVMESGSSSGVFHQI